jgi:DNA-binding SARP family transcriptional activator
MVYEVTEQGRSRTRLQRAAVLAYTKLVGREQVMDALWRAADQARADMGKW